MGAFEIRLRMIHEKITVFIPDAKVEIIGNVNLETEIAGLKLFSSKYIPQPQYLYFCTAEDLDKLTEEYWDMTIVCVNNTGKSLEISAPFRIIIVNTEMKLPQVFNLLTEIVDTAYGVSRVMQEYEAGEQNLQKVLIQGEALFTNIYMILDPGFMLKGYSQGRKSDNEFYNRTIAEKALDSEHIMQLITNNVFLNLQQHGEMLLKENNFLTEVPVFIKQISAGDTVLGYGLLICANTPPMKNMLMTFSAFISYCQKYLLNDKKVSRLSLKYQHELFLISIIEKRFTQNKQIRNIAPTFQLDADDSYVLLRILYRDWEQYPHRYVMENLEALLNEHIIFCYQQGMQVLIKKSRLKYHYTEEKRNKYWTYLNKYNAVCGISNEFQGLKNLGYAYMQARVALEYGQKMCDIKEKTYFNYDDKVFVYSNYEMLDMIHCYYQTKQELPPYLPQLEELFKADQEKETEYVQLLFDYMQNGYSINKTASAIFMHRNSLVYRLNAMEEVTEINIDDTLFRELLPFTYRVLDYKTAYLEEKEI